MEDDRKSLKQLNFQVTYIACLSSCTSHEALMNAMQKKQPFIAFACISACTLAHKMPLQNGWLLSLQTGDFLDVAIY